MAHSSTVRLLIPVPTSEVAEEEQQEITVRQGSPEHRALGLLDNTKLPVEAIYAGLRRQVEESYSPVRVLETKKQNTCVPASPELLISFENQCAFVINGIGD